MRVRENVQETNGGEQSGGGCLPSYLTDVCRIAHHVLTKQLDMNNAIKLPFAFFVPQGR